MLCCVFFAADCAAELKDVAEIGSVYRMFSANFLLASVGYDNYFLSAFSVLTDKKKQKMQKRISKILAQTVVLF